MAASRILPAFALLLLAALVPAAGRAGTMTFPLVTNFDDPEFEPFYAHLGRLLDAKVEGGRLVAASTRAAGAGSLAPLAIGGTGPRGVFVTVSATFADAGDGDPKAGAGIIVKYSDGAGGKAFYSFIRTRGGVLLNAWGGNGITQTIASGLPGGPDKPVRLAARESGAGVEFFVDGVSFATLSTGGVTGSDIGLAVFGAGTYAFDDFGANTRGDIEVKAGGDIGATAGSPTVPLRATFQDPQFEPFYKRIAGSLGGGVQDGRFVIQSRRANGAGDLYTYELGGKAIASLDADVAADMAADANAMAGAGLVLKHSEDGAGSSYYTFLRTRGGALISTYRGGVNTQNLEVALPEAAGKPVHLSAKLSGAGVAFFADGQPLGTLTDTGITGHRIGLAVFGSGTYAFDNLVAVPAAP